MKKRPKSDTSRAKRPGRTLAYPVEFRLRMVRLFLEEGYSATALGEQFGVSCHSIAGSGPIEARAPRAWSRSGTPAAVPGSLLKFGNA